MVTKGMGFEVDYMAVGDGEKSGDAIAMRWGYLGGGPADQRVIVIDGGTKESGLALVEHIRRYYRTNWVNLVVCTHCDADHASGLAVVLEQLRVGKLLMHEPWVHAEEIYKLVTDGRVTKRSLPRRIERGLEAAHNLRKLAERRDVRVVEPFSDLKATPLGQTIRILGPSRKYYEQLLSKFRCVPETDNTLDSPPTTSAENNSSAIILLTILGHNMMFTGDAGVEALTHAIDYGQQRGLDFSNLELFHVPHHGSEHNIDPHVLARFRSRVAVVSAAPDGAPKHPSSRVTNALMDCGTAVYATQGRASCHRFNAPLRPGWGPATQVPYDESLSPEESLTRVVASPLAAVNPRSIAGGYLSQPRFPRSSR